MTRRRGGSPKGIPICGKTTIRRSTGDFEPAVPQARLSRRCAICVVPIGPLRNKGQHRTSERTRMKILPRQSELPTLLRQPSAFARRYRLVLLPLLAAGTADAVTTFVNVSRYGTDTELHPAQRFVFDTAGVAAGVPIAKAIQLGFVLFVAAWWRPWCRWILLLCAVLYGFAAMSNHNLWL